MLFFRKANFWQLTSFSQWHFLFIIWWLTLSLLAFSDTKLLWGAQSGASSENPSCRSRNLFFYSSTYHPPFTQIPLNCTVYRKMWKILVIRLFHKSIDFSTESVKKPSNLWLAVYSSKISINIPLKWKISTSRATLL